jgi:isopropylmalate/homocitrate/citramalate synthase
VSAAGPAVGLNEWRDVTLRDGLQPTGKALTTDRKSRWRV